MRLQSLLQCPAPAGTLPTQNLMFTGLDNVLHHNRHREHGCRAVQSMVEHVALTSEYLIQRRESRQVWLPGLFRAAVPESLCPCYATTFTSELVEDHFQQQLSKCASAQLRYCAQVSPRRSYPRRIAKARGRRPRFASRRTRSCCRRRTACHCSGRRLGSRVRGGKALCDECQQRCIYIACIVLLELLQGQRPNLSRTGETVT